MIRRTPIAATTAVTTTRTLATTALVAGVATVALTLAGCSSADASAASSASSTPVAGGDLRFAISSDLGCIDPQQIGNNDDINIARQTVASLTTQDPSTGAIKPWLATSWKVNADATSFTFTLRKGATYSDGSPIDAQSVKDNFEGIQALGAKATLGSTYLSGLSGITVENARTVQIDFSAPSAQFLQATSTFSLGLLAPSSVSLTPAERCAGDFKGSGPFTVKSYTPNAKAVLARRADYAWAPSTESHQGAAYLDTITYSVVPEASTLTGSLTSGQVDASNDVQATDVTQLDGNGYWTKNRANPGVTYNLFPNARNAILADQDVRVAISKAIDRDAIAKLLTKWDKPATSVLAASTPDFTDHSALLRQDVSGAKKLLNADGWKVGTDGIRQKDGKPLSFTLVYWQNESDELQLVQQQLKAIGVDLQLKQTTIADATAKNDGTQAFSFYNLTRADPDVLRTVFSANGTSQVNHRPASAVDTLLTKQAQTTNTTERKKLVDQAARDLIEQGWSIPINQLSTTIAARDSVHGLTFEASSRLDFYDAWLSE